MQNQQTAEEIKTKLLIQQLKELSVENHILIRKTLE